MNECNKKPHRMYISSPPPLLSFVSCCLLPDTRWHLLLLPVLTTKILFLGSLSLMIQRLLQNPASASAMLPRQKPDLIAVTRGPGMGGCLSVGVTTAKAL